MTSKDFGEFIRRRRKFLKITQRELAASCGTGLRFISDLENGKPTCQLSKAFDILSGLGLDIHLAQKPAREGAPQAAPEWRVW